MCKDKNILILCILPLIHCPAKSRAQQRKALQFNKINTKSQKKYFSNEYAFREEFGGKLFEDIG